MMHKNIEVIDNFLDDNEWIHIHDLLLGYSFPWYYFDGIDYPKQNNLFQFVHTFYDDTRDGVTSSFFNICYPIFTKLKIVDFARIKANLNTITTESLQLGKYHIDYSDMITAIYYVNSNNGYTKFECGDIVESISNRMVIFDSNIKHVGYSCTDEKTRCLINFNYCDD